MVGALVGGKEVAVGKGAVVFVGKGVWVGGAGVIVGSKGIGVARAAEPAGSWVTGVGSSMVAVGVLKTTTLAEVEAGRVLPEDKLAACCSVPIIIGPSRLIAKYPAQLQMIKMATANRPPIINELRLRNNDAPKSQFGYRDMGQKLMSNTDEL
jgi:hypothetical protein